MLSANTNKPTEVEMSKMLTSSEPESYVVVVKLDGQDS